MAKIIDPLEFGKMCWPHVSFYKEQREIIYSVVENAETYVPAGNMMGKDYVGAFIALYFFVSRHPCRIVTTSADYKQLEAVLWGEIRRFIQTSAAPYRLSSEHGGPLLVNQLYVRKIVNGEIDGLSYIMGRTAEKGEGMLGHHIAKTGDEIPRTLFMADEASGVDDLSYNRADTWADRKLIIGNPFPCENFFRKGVRKGNVPSETGKGFYSKVIKIKCEASPNVRFALSQINQGKKPTGEMLVDGVMNYWDYLKRRKTWDPVKQCICLDAEFYEGAEIKLYPPIWLDHSERLAKQGKRYGIKKTLGIDSGQGGNNTAFAVCEDWGLIYLESLKTPDTTEITSKTLALMRKFNIAAEDVLFDGGGGGKQHADRLRKEGHKVQIIMFGSKATAPRRRGMTTMDQRNRQDETRMAYKNRRCEMYGMLRTRIDPSESGGFAIPQKYVELRRQLSVFPLTYNEEGVMVLPPKSKRDPQDTRVTLTEMLGCSPDEADAVVLATYGLSRRSFQTSIGVVA